MNNIATLPSSSGFTGRQLDLIRNTVARDCQPEEFNLFIAVAQRAGLDPFRKQISALVFNKNKPEKRRMSIITGIDGLRAIAARSSRYRPDENEPEITYLPDLKGPTNPLGIEKAVVRINIRDDGGAEWRPVAGVAYWDEFAPITEEWAEDERTGKRRPSGKMVLDASGNWFRMGRVMISKCAEAQALRKAFPEDLSGLYEGAEMDQARVVDLTPTEIIEAAHVDERLERVGGKSGIMFQLSATSPLEPIALGKITDRVIDASTDWDLNQLRWFESANTHPLREFWARAQADALGLKKHLEGLRAKLQAGQA